MKISKSFKIYIHIILIVLISKNLFANEDFSKNIVIYEKPNKLIARDFFQSIGVASLDIYFDPDFKLVKQFKMRGLPISILIDKNGKEFGRVVGEIDFMNEDFIELLKRYI